MKSSNYLVMSTILFSTCSMVLAAGNDDLWEMNISMNAGGHSMPLQAMQSCMPKGQDHPTPPDKSCKASGQGGLTGKGSMVMECAGPPPYSVKIEGTRTANSMKGTMTVNSGGTSMVQEFSGKVIGSCDASTFTAPSQAGGMPPGGMPPGAMRMPSFNPSAMVPK